MTHVLSHLQSRVTHVIIRGAGNKAFSAGGDILQLSTSKYEFSKDILRYTLASFAIVSNFKVPYIAIMNGITMGGGSSYSIAGKYRIATERTIYAMPETLIGFFNDAGASFFLPRLPNNIGIYLGLTGARLKGFDVKKVGLATHYVESRKIEDLEKALISCKNEKEIVEVIESFTSTPEDEKSEIDEITVKIDKCFAADSIEKIYENLEKDGSHWAENTIQTLNQMSPTSLKVSLRNMVEGKKLTLHECLTLDYRVGAHHLIKSDLKEGVRALLIDKDLKPKWNPGTVEDVTENHVERFYKPLPLQDDLEFQNHLKHKI